MEIGAPWLNRLSLPQGILDRALDVQGGTLVALALRIHREFQLQDDASALALEGLLLEFLAEAWRWHLTANQRRPPRWAEQAREMLHARFAENLPLSFLAEAVGVHPVYLASAFRRHYGRSIGTYLRQLRVDYACRQLATTAAPLAEVALAAGFADQSHFSRVFKAHTGLTPAAFRREARLS
jgi:AraC family transcriptional regulator